MWTAIRLIQRSGAARPGSKRERLVKAERRISCATSRRSLRGVPSRLSQASTDRTVSSRNRRCSTWRSERGRDGGRERSLGDLIAPDLERGRGGLRTQRGDGGRGGPCAGQEQR